MAMNVTIFLIKLSCRALKLLRNQFSTKANKSVSNIPKTTKNVLNPLQTTCVCPQWFVEGIRFGLTCNCLNVIQMLKMHKNVFVMQSCLIFDHWMDMKALVIFLILVWSCYQFQGTT